MDPPECQLDTEHSGSKKAGNLLTETLLACQGLCSMQLLVLLLVMIARSRI